MGRQTPNIVAQSIAEAECIAACEASMEGRGIMNMLDVVLQCILVRMVWAMEIDNSAAICLACKPKLSRLSKYRDAICMRVIHEPKCSNASVEGGVL